LRISTCYASEILKPVIECNAQTSLSEQAMEDTFAKVILAVHKF